MTYDAESPGGLCPECEALIRHMVRVPRTKGQIEDAMRHGPIPQVVWDIVFSRPHSVLYEIVTKHVTGPFSDAEAEGLDMLGHALLDITGSDESILDEDVPDGWGE